jgi:hypothetical protein
LPSLIRGWHFKNITAANSSRKNPAVKNLGLYYRLSGELLPLFKHLGSRFFPKNNRFLHRVEKVRLASKSHDFSLAAGVSDDSVGCYVDK